jgi:outer membrane protein OmpA-like peptidoglycan-associated protein
MHPAIPIVVMAFLISLLEEEKKPPPEKLVTEPRRDWICLVPDADGGTGKLVVTTSLGETLLDRAYALADVYPQGKVEQRTVDASVVERRFASALAARPLPPVSFTVHFVAGKDQLTTEFLAQFSRIKAELAARPAPEIVVIGHTDRVGAVEHNDRLSLQRAQSVGAALIAAGVAAAQIETAGRGEREPAVPTADEVHEPRNRRVEITIR